MQSSLARVILSALSFSLCPPVSVYSTGTASLNRSFSRQCRICDLCPLDTSPSGLTFKHADLPTCPCYSLRKAIPSAFSHTLLRHSVTQATDSGTGILTCFPFAITSLLTLRSRLPRGGQTFPRKPWTSGRRDSRPPSRYSFLHSRF